MTLPTALTEWAPVPGHAERYEVSRDGRVRAHKTGRELAHAIDRQGYHLVSLYRLHDDHPMKRVHVLVLLAFKGPCPPYHEGGHLNGDPGDNSIENLAWVTRKTNAEHRAQHGRTASGTRHGSAKLSETSVKLIRDLRAMGHQGKEIADIVGVSPSQVWKVASGQYWKHV